VKDGTRNLYRREDVIAYLEGLEVFAGR